MPIPPALETAAASSGPAATFLYDVEQEFVLSSKNGKRCGSKVVSKLAVRKVGWSETHMPASMIGCLIPKASVSGVLICCGDAIVALDVWKRMAV